MPHSGPTLEVNLSALTENYRILRERFSGKECGAVVKASAYGIGVREVAKTLDNSGCRTFFVATLDEGIELRGILPSATIFVFHGPYKGEEKDYTAHKLIPVLNSVEQTKRWDMKQPFAIHIDTGMNRLGLTLEELASCQLSIANYQLLISHLACASDDTDPKNAEQLATFSKARALLPQVPASLCNSSGIFLGKDFHFDVARPGCALYGITEHKNPMKPVVTLSAPILQLRTVDIDGTVGYGATADVKKGATLAIAQLGYADGYFRSLSNSGTAYISGRPAPVVGRVSMDMLALDVSAIPPLPADARAEFINAQYTVDALASDAGTIGYEVLTRLGKRVKRVYSGGAIP